MDFITKIFNIWRKLWNDESTRFISGHCSILLSPAQIVHWNFLQVAGTPIYFPVRKTNLQNSFRYCGWRSKRENYALTKWVLFLFPKWKVFTLFRFLVSTWGRIYDYSKHWYSKHRSMWWRNKVLVFQFKLSTSFQRSFN